MHFRFALAAPFLVAATVSAGPQYGFPGGAPPAPGSNGPPAGGSGWGQPWGGANHPHGPWPVPSPSSVAPVSAASETCTEGESHPSSVAATSTGAVSAPTTTTSSSWTSSIASVGSSTGISSGVSTSVSSATSTSSPAVIPIPHPSSASGIASYRSSHGHSSGFHHSSAASGYRSSTRVSSSSTATPTPTGKCSYWLDDVKHQGIAAFNADPATYQVYRNVKDFGAKGDGVTDDTDAINSAISFGDRCTPGSCNSTTTTPAVVYFPPGTYIISSSIIDYYYTQLIGNPNCLPTIRASADFKNAIGTTGLIDGDIYGSNGQLTTGATNVFWRQVRNFILDTTQVPADTLIRGVHWPTGQATSIQNVIFHLNSNAGTQHEGIFIEQGSGGFIGDLVFYGGHYGGNFGNQQFTMRNLSFHDVVVAINQIWDWGWTYQNIQIANSTIGLNMSSGGPTAQAVGSVTLFDSKISNTKIGILTAHSLDSQPPASGSLIVENVHLDNVDVAIQGANGATALGSTSYISAWGEGHSYLPKGPNNFEGPISANNRPAGLVDASTGDYYQRSKPQYEGVPASQFISARTAGATGDGKTDDTKALQGAVDQAVSEGKILFIDHGTYRVTSTITLPAGAKVVGESYSVIMSSGSFFDDIDNPKPVVQIGTPGEQGSIEWTDTIVSTQGQQRGAVLFEYNLQSPSDEPTGLWDVHARVGGFAGSQLQLPDCPTTPKIVVTADNLETKCIAAFMTFHITKPSSSLYLENVWLWVADHDIEDPNVTQITIYAGRGFLDESAAGNVWLIGTAVEHHVLYEYQFAHTRDVFMGQIQTETAYYQPNPSAPLPFPYVAALEDPVFASETVTTSNGTVIPAANGWGLRIVGSQDIFAYGVGLYSFFNNYSTNCSAIGNFEVCQDRIASVEQSTGVSLYNLNTVGTHWPLTLDGQDVVYFEDNIDNFVDTVALFRV